jgi:hypothetical protein
LPSTPPTPISALFAARKKLDEDTTNTWLLVALAAAGGFMFSAELFLQVFFITVQSAFNGQPASALYSIPLVLGGIALAFVLPTLVVLGANRAYRRQYDWITAEMVHGDMALMLIDESYGRMIQEWRENTYRLKLGEVYLGQTFSERLVHFGAYSMQYYRMALGQREFKVTPATPLNCWMDGLLLGCATCSSLGCAVWFTVVLPLRIVYTYPRSIATRRAALDYFSGKWEMALERKYVSRIDAPPAPNWG